MITLLFSLALADTADTADTGANDTGGDTADSAVGGGDTEETEAPEDLSDERGLCGGCDSGATGVGLGLLGAVAALRRRR